MPGPPPLVRIASREPAGRGLFGHQFGAVEHSGQRRHPDDARPFEGGVIDRILAGHGPDMGGGCPSAGRAFAGLEHDDRFDPRDGAGRAHEFAGIGQVFHVDENGFDRPVVAQVVDHVAKIDIEHGADTDEMTEPRIFLGGSIQGGCADGPALGDEAHIAHGRHTGDEAGVQLFTGADDAKTVGADDPHARTLGRPLDLFFDQAARLAQFLAAGGDDDHPQDPGTDALADNLRRGGDGRGDDSQFRGGFHLGDRAVGLEPMNGFMVGIHRNNGSAEAALDEVVDQGGADGVLFVFGAYNRDAFRVKELFHAVSRPFRLDVLSFFPALFQKCRQRSNRKTVYLTYPFLLCLTSILQHESSVK